MKVLENVEEQVVIGQLLDSQDFTISSNSRSIIIDSLINLYEDPIGSIVREITSNCLDAHKERDLKLSQQRPLEPGENLAYFNKENPPIEISYHPLHETSTGAGVMVFKDQGVGLSEDRIRQVFTVFGGSSKRDSNDEIGGFGLGAKAPFAYTNTFYIRSYVNGMNSLYLLDKSNFAPTLSLVYNEPTKELNGTEVIIPIKEQNDLIKFIVAIQKQLSFFPEITYNIPGHVIHKANILYESEDFLCNALDKNRYHSVGILIGNIEYRLNEQLVNSGYILQSNVKLKFNIGELDLVPSREAIRYTDDTIQKIKAKIKKVYEHVTNKLQELVDNEKDLKLKYMMFMIANNYRSRIPAFGPVNTLFSIFASPKIKIHFDDSDFFKRITDAILTANVALHNIYTRTNKVYIKEITGYTKLSIILAYLFNDKDSIPIYYKSGSTFNRAKNLAISDFYTVTLKTGDPEVAYFLTKYIFSSLPTYESIQEVKVKKQSSKKVVNEQNIIYKVAYTRNSGIIWRRAQTSLQYLQTHHCKIIYGVEANKEKLKIAAATYGNNKYIVVNRAIANVIKLYSNFQHIDEFVSDINQLYQDRLAAQYLKEVLQDFSNLCHFADINKDLFNAYIEAKAYYDKYRIVQKEKIFIPDDIQFQPAPELKKIVDTFNVIKEHYSFLKYINWYVGATEALIPIINLIYEKHNGKF